MQWSNLKGITSLSILTSSITRLCVSEVTTYEISSSDIVRVRDKEIINSINRKLKKEKIKIIMELKTMKPLKNYQI